ncbi:DUF624 domain-containing protein [Enterococcus sp. ZJ1668]|uniref:DUF624 domain-containing protein n=1 Tax=Enterococcus sp. ZJ1668 TaxID=2709402 RepID=UPI0013EC7105|nr:DUF624 domain-containing protein [Enterococcus sp. ZJ1668]
MIRKKHADRLNHWVLDMIEWIPRLAGLQLLWFVSVLPLLTIGSASRAVIHVIYRYKMQEEGLHLFSSFFSEGYHSFKKYWKQDLLFSTYFWLLLIDSRIFHYLGGGVALSLMYATVILIFLSVIVFFYKVLLQLETSSKVTALLAFVQLFRFPKLVLAHFLGTIGLLVILSWLGPIYLFVLGMSVTIYFQVVLFLNKKRIA